VLIRHKHCRHRTLKILIGQSFKNLFSRTEEGIGMKPGTYVPKHTDDRHQVMAKAHTPFSG
jgi:hypothetical protein